MLKNGLKKYSLFLLFLLMMSIWLKCSSSVYAQNTGSYSVTVAIDKSSVNVSDEFQVTINASNTGTTINNFEIRIPYYRTINDTQMLTENPSFNKILDSGDYPSGFNSRSWIINSFGQGESKTYIVKYKINEDPKISNGLTSNLSLPAEWKDPAGLASGAPITIQNFRADIYINSIYKESFQAPLPKLEALDNPVSQVTLNSGFYFPGSKSTNLKDITATNIKAFSNFKLETQDVLIEWTSPIDFSGAEVAGKLQTLDTNLKVGWGKVEFNADQFPFLAKPAQVTYKNVTFVTEPKIKIDKNTVSLTDAKAQWVPTKSSVTISHVALVSSALVPKIETEKSVIETSENKITIKGTVSDPNANVSYKIDNSDVKDVVGIDLKTGIFEIDLTNVDKIKQVEITSKFKNNESDSKIVLIKYKGDEKGNLEDVKATNTPAKTNTTILFNPITIALILSALAVVSVIGGYIYYLYYRKKKNKKNLDKAQLKDISIITPEKSNINKPVFAEGIALSATEKIDLNALKDEYLMEDDNESNAKKNDSETGKKST